MMRINFIVRQESHAGCLGLEVLLCHTESFLWQLGCPENNLYILYQMHLHPTDSLHCNGLGTRPHMAAAEHILCNKVKIEKKYIHIMHLTLKNLSTIILI